MDSERGDREQFDSGAAENIPEDKSGDATPERDFYYYNEPRSDTNPTPGGYSHNPPASPPGVSSPCMRGYYVPVPPPPPPPPGGSRGVMKAALITASVIIVIIASALVFMSGGESGYLFEPPYVSENPAPSRIPSTDEFGVSREQVLTSIPTAPVGSGVTLDLSSLPSGGELSLQEIYSKCAESVVAIKAEVADGYYWGTGIVFSSDGYIVTNAHIISGTSSAIITLWDDSEYEAALVGHDTLSDLAVLKIDARGLTAAEFGDSAILEVGDSVVAIGNPLGATFRGTMTDGIISAIDRDVSYNNHSMTLLQTNAAINEGNSGGPLINMYGQVIGITNMKMMSSYYAIEGIGFAIPSRTLKTVVDQLIEKGVVSGRPALGVTVGQIPSTAAAYYTLPGGLYVSAVAKNSDAYAKGIRIGDIILEAGGTPVITSDDINLVRDGYKVGDELKLLIYRDDETFEVSVVLMEKTELYG